MDAPRRPGEVGGQHLSYRRIISGARAAMLVAGTAAAVRVVLTNGQRMEPVYVQADRAPRPILALAGAGTVSLPNPADAMLRRLYAAALIAAGGMIAIAAIATGVTFLFRDTSAPGPIAVSHGPSDSLRAASGAARGYESAYAAAMPPAGDVAGMLYAAAEEQQAWDVLRAMVSLAEGRQAQQARVSSMSARPAAGTPQTLNRPSGYAAGTVLRARITVYGCTGPGGGFCGGMASGVRVFEGAAACSYDLPFGTKLRIIGDPTGRIYECLDRGALSSTWVDVFFNDTSEGIRWTGLLGGTTTDIEIVN